MSRGILTAVEVSNKILLVVDEVLRNSPNYTGKIVVDINCKGGSVVSMNAIERREVEL